MYNRIVISLLLLLATPLYVYGQKTETVSGTYTYYAPSTVSLEDARRIVVERAKIAALADVFGTSIQSTTMTSIRNSTDGSKVDVSTLAESEVKGEWLSDIGEPEISISYADGMLVLTAKVRGTARKIEEQNISFEAKLLRNGTNPKYESDTFSDGDDVYLWFRTPVAGYLSVYLMDGDDVYCLLPYRSDKYAATPVERGREYIFFSVQCAGRGEVVDEYILTTDKSLSHNHIFVVFSTNEYAKTNDTQSNNIMLPRQTSRAAFESWLSKCRVYDSKMKVKQISVTISKK